MRFSSIFYGIVSLALFTQALPVPDASTNGILERAVSKSKTTAKVAAARPVAKTPTVAATRPVAKKSTAKATAKKPTAKATAKKSTAKTTAKKSPVATKPVATKAPASCPLYLEADRLDISRRELGELEKRADEEFWFRWEDPSIVKGTNILQLATRSGNKDFDDQAYKWLSTDAAKVIRSSFPKRVPTIYVLPSGTREKLLAQAKDFEKTKAAKERVDFVTKDNEPGDIGIQGVSAAAKNKQIPLDQFRALIKRIVVKEVATSGNNKATFTTITMNKGKAGKPSRTATKPDQAVLDKITNC